MPRDVVTWKVQSEKAVVTLKPDGKRRALLAIPTGGGDEPTEAQEPHGVFTMVVYDLGTRYATRTDPTGDPDGFYTTPQYLEISMEERINAPAEDRVAIMSVLVDARRRVAVIRSGRDAWTTWALPGASTETDAMAVRVTLRHVETHAERPYELQGDTESWRRARTADERVEEYEERVASATDPAEAERLRTVLERARQHSFEGWYPQIAGRVGRDGTLTARLSPGSYTAAFESAANLYNPCDPADEENYATKVLPGSATEDTGAPRFPVGVRQSSHVEYWAVPAVHEITVSWWAHYAWGTLFSGGDFFIPQVRRWRQRLPVFPYAFGLGGGGQSATNDVAVSEQLERSVNYREMIAADRFLETFSPFFFVILIERIEGQYLWGFGDYLAGTLAGIYRVDAVDYFVYRTTTEFRSAVAFAAGTVSTGDVQPFTGFYEFALPLTVQG